MVAHSLRTALAAAAVLALTWLAVPAFSQSQSPRWAPDRLRSAIEERYNVVPMKDGVVLVPRRENPKVKLIEVRGETIAIDGSPVTGAELRDRLGADADAVLALSYLDPAGRRALFEPTEPGAPSPQQPSNEGGSAAPSTTTPEERPVETRSVRTQSRVHIGGSVHVAENEVVDGPVVAIGGPVTVDGEVHEDVVAIAGSVRLGPKAKVSGDVTAVGGRVERDPGAEIEGKVNEIRFGDFPRIHFGRGFWFPSRGFFAGAFGRSVELMATLFRMLLFGLLAVLILLIARDPVGRIERAAAFEPWKAGLVGLLTQLLFVPAFVLTIVILAISIIGIPLLLFVPPLAILALFAALVVGFTGVAYGVGGLIERRFGWGARGAFAPLLVGLLGIWGLTILGRVVSLGGWPIWFVASALLVVGFLVEYVAWTVGLGAAVMTRFGTRWPGGTGPATAGSAAAAPPQVGGPA